MLSCSLHLVHLRVNGPSFTRFVTTRNLAPRHVELFHHFVNAQVLRCNGALLNAAEEAGVDLLLSTDQGIRYQQNLAGRKIALVVLTGATKWSRVRLHMDCIAAAVAAANSGTYAEIEIPFK